jgi:hypothetical protein
MPTLYAPLKINGVISTDKTVLQNLNDICNACGAFLTFDISQGKWSVVINTTGSSIKSYGDSNIIGNITVSETGVNELYNSATFEFPHKSLRDQTDFVEVVIPSGDRLPNEIENPLQLQSQLINDPVQAQYIAGIELKQKRLNKIIQFTTDYTSLGLKAGDLIDVTAAMYGFTSKVFRVTKIEEVDDDVIGINITGMEYDANVYSTAGLVFNERTKKTGILLRQQNDVIKELDDANVAGSIGRMIAANVGLGIANNLLNKLFGRRQIGTDANGNPIYSRQTKPADTSAEELDKLLATAKKPALTTISDGGTLCEGASKTITVGHSCDPGCLFEIPAFNYAYTITGISAGDINIPLTGNVLVTNGTGSLTFTATNDATAEGSGTGIETATVTIGGLSTTVAIHDQVDFTYAVSANTASITEGGSVTITLTATGTKATASVPYTITGSATGKVDTAVTPLTGNIATSGGTGTLVINTNASPNSFTGTQGLTISIDPAQNNPCVSATVSVTVLDTLAVSTNVQYVKVPAIWNGQYDSSNVLIGLTVKKYVWLPVPLGGETTVNVPTAVSVTRGSPSTISITATTPVAASSYNVGGYAVRLITAFNSISTGNLITGTVSTFHGYDDGDVPLVL